MSEQPRKKHWKNSPPNAIGRWQLDNEVDDEQLAALMSEKLGRTITAAGVRAVSRRSQPPQAWLDALSLAPSDHASERAEPAPPPSGGGGVRDQLRPPAAVLPFEPVAAREQIRLMYTFGGKGAATVLRAPAVEGVWANAAPSIADAWIEWAKVNSTVAGVISAMTLGGPAGQLVLLHGSLIASSLIVSGRINVDALVPPTFRQEDAADGSEPGETVPPPSGDASNGKRRGPVRSVD